MERVIFHIHTRYSHDSLIHPRKILKICKQLKINTVYITDHNTIKGSFVAKKYEKEFNIKVVPGIEVKTEYGDIIGVDITEDIKTRNFEEVIDIIKQQGGVSILPHPFRGHKNIEYLASKVDIIEVWNARNSPEQNQKALDLAKKLNKPQIAGSDAHLYSEISNAILEFSSLFDPEKRFICLKYSKPWQQQVSSLIGHIRQGEIWNVLFVILKLFKL